MRLPGHRVRQPAAPCSAAPASPGRSSFSQPGQAHLRTSSPALTIGRLRSAHQDSVIGPPRAAANPAHPWELQPTLLPPCRRIVRRCLHEVRHSAALPTSSHDYGSAHRRVPPRHWRDRTGAVPHQCAGVPARAAIGRGSSGGEPCITRRYGRPPVRDPAIRYALRFGRESVGASSTCGMRNAVAHCNDRYPSARNCGGQAHERAHADEHVAISGRDSTVTAAPPVALARPPAMQQVVESSGRLPLRRERCPRTRLPVLRS